MKSYNTLTKNTLITIDTLMNLDRHIKYKNLNHELNFQKHKYENQLLNNTLLINYYRYFKQHILSVNFIIKYSNDFKYIQQNIYDDIYFKCYLLNNKNIYNIPNKKNIHKNIIQIIESDECKSFFQKKIMELL